MDVVELATAREFLDRSEAFLLEHESHHNLLLGFAEGTATGTRPSTAPLYYLLLDRSQLVGAALRTDPERPLALSVMPKAAAIALAHSVPSGLRGCVGQTEVSTAFADTFTKRYGCGIEYDMAQGVYELRTLRLPPGAETFELVTISEATRTLAEDFARAFMIEVQPHEHDIEDRVREGTERRLRLKSMFFLCRADGHLVATAASARQTRNTACVSLVYTPPEYRGRGYGSMVTALVTQKLLAGDKKACNLFTDLANPTSNSIYQKIGYEKLGESRHVTFSRPRESGGSGR